MRKTFVINGKGPTTIYTPMFWIWQTTGGETGSNNKRYRLHLLLLLFFGEYQTCFRVLIDKIANICGVLARTKVPDIIIIGLVHGNLLVDNE